ncbi:MAG: NAD(P)-dependent alcohol dehydrogenase, partial [Deinococcota bacterium]
MKTISCPSYGPPDVLHLAERPKPVPADNELLIKIHATTVSVADCRVRGFNIPKGIRLPARFILGFRRPKRTVLGAELAGEIEAVGTSVRRFKPGDQVFASALPQFGAYAEYICLAEDAAVATKPSNMSYEEAATVPIGARTAWHYLRKGNLQAGQHVLIYGASGSVGSYAVQLAKYWSATVTAVCGPSNLELVRSLGADKAIDYTRSDFTLNVNRYDVVFDVVNKVPFRACLRALKANGSYLNCTSPVPSLQMLWAMLTSNKTLILGQSPLERPDELESIKTLIEAGNLRTVIDSYYPLEDIVAAHRYVDLGHKKGNVAITVVAPTSTHTRHSDEKQEPNDTVLPIERSL